MRRQKAFTLVELLVVIAIIALLLSILMPALKKARGQAYKVVCISNLRQASLANSMYLQDYHAYNYYTGYWELALEPYLSARAKSQGLELEKIHKIYRCPADKKNAKGPFVAWTRVPTSYCPNVYFALQATTWSFFLKESEITKRPSDVFFRSDQYFTNAQTAGWIGDDAKLENYYIDSWLNGMDWHDGDKANMLYCDGHVKTIVKLEAMRRGYRKLPTGETSSGSLNSGWKIK